MPSFGKSHYASSKQGSVLYDIWNPKFTKPVTLIVVAPRGSGKSVLIGDILFQNKDFFDDVHVFAGSDAVVSDYQKKLPKSRLTRGYSDAKMERIIKLFKSTAIAFQEYKPDRCFHGALLLDDLGFDKKIFRSVAHLEAWMNSRHCKLSLFLCVQFVTMLPPTIRAQVDYAIALRDPIKANHKRLHDMFFGAFESQRDFSREFTRLTENFGAMVAFNRSRSSKLSGCIYQYRGIERGDDHRLCNPRVWAIDRANRLLRKIKRLEDELKREQMRKRGATVY